MCLGWVGRREISAILHYLVQWSHCSPPRTCSKQWSIRPWNQSNAYIYSDQWIFICVHIHSHFVHAYIHTYQESFSIEAVLASRLLFLYGSYLCMYVCRGQIKKMMGDAPNRMQDIWIWNGRPHWDDIFAEMLKNRQHRCRSQTWNLCPQLFTYIHTYIHSDIGVCFCGAPIIGADLAAM